MSSSKAKQHISYIVRPRENISAEGRRSELLRSSSAIYLEEAYMEEIMMKKSWISSNYDDDEVIDDRL
jgi:hypothetical protein